MNHKQVEQRLRDTFAASSAVSEHAAKLRPRNNVASNRTSARRLWFWGLPMAAAVAIIAILITFSTQAPRAASTRLASNGTVMKSSTVGSAGVADLCATPTSNIAIMRYVTNARLVTTSPTMYTAKQKPGIGPLCRGLMSFGTASTAHYPADAAVFPVPNIVPYLTLHKEPYGANSFSVWGAVGPTVARLGLALSSEPTSSFAVTPTATDLTFLDLGSGWHGFNLPANYSFASGEPVELIATVYDKSGRLLGMRRITFPDVK